jgi:hypothetical protein
MINGFAEIGISGSGEGVQAWAIVEPSKQF